MSCSLKISKSHICTASKCLKKKETITVVASRVIQSNLNPDLCILLHVLSTHPPVPQKKENAATAILDPKLVAESFNDYFIGVGPELTAESNIDLGDEEPPIHKVNKELQLPSQAHPHQQLRHQTYGVEKNGHKQQK